MGSDVAPEERPDARAGQGAHVKGVVTRGKRLIGQLLIDGGFVTPSELERALACQRETNEQLGQVLVRLGKLAPAELAAALALQDRLTDPQAGARLAAGIRERLGELLVRASRITRPELEAALQEQGRTGAMLGDILVRRGLLEAAELDRALAIQRIQSGEVPGENCLKLGRILVATDLISREQLEDALARQRRSGRRLGDELVATGAVKAAQLEQALALQRKLVTAALAIALSFAAPLAAEAADAHHAFGTVQVSATVVPVARVRGMQQPASLQVTAADIARGFVEVPAASTVELTTNSRQGVVLSFYNMAGFVKAIAITGLAGAVELGASGGDVVERFAAQAPAARALTLGFRFTLGAEARPGTYAWPLMLAVRPL